MLFYMLLLQWLNTRITRLPKQKNTIITPSSKFSKCIWTTYLLPLMIISWHHNTNKPCSSVLVHVSQADVFHLERKQVIIFVSENLNYTQIPVQITFSSLKSNTRSVPNYRSYLGKWTHSQNIRSLIFSTFSRIISIDTVQQ